MKKIFLNKARKLAKLKPDLTGTRIIAGLRAHAGLISDLRQSKDTDLCQLIVDWRLGGYNQDFLADGLSPVREELSVIFAAGYLDKLDRARDAMKEVPGITDDEANGFNQHPAAKVIKTLYYTSP